MHEWCGRWEQRRRKAKRAHRESAPVHLDVQPPGQGTLPQASATGARLRRRSYAQVGTGGLWLTVLTLGIASPAGPLARLTRAA